MAQDFVALIEGRADLTKAKQSFDAFKKQVETPIKITLDTNGFNAVWGNIQKQAQQSGIQIGNSLVQGVQKTIRSGSNSGTSSAYSFQEPIQMGFMANRANNRFRDIDMEIFDD